MCHAAVNWVLNDLADREDLKPAEKWFLIVLADHAGREAWSFVHGHKRLAKDAGMSVRTVISMLAKFEEIGLLRRTHRFRDDGSRSTDLMALLGGENPALGAIQSAEDDADFVQIATPEGVKPAQRKEGTKPGKLTQEETAPRAPAHAGPKGSRIPADWKPSNDDHVFAVGEGLDPSYVPRLAAEFLDYWKSVAGQKGVKIDWSATWRNRVRDRVEHLGGRGGQRTHDAGADESPAARRRRLERDEPMQRGIMAALERRRGQGRGNPPHPDQPDPASAAGGDRPGPGSGEQADYGDGVDEAIG